MISLGYPIVPIRAGHEHPAGLANWQKVEATVETLVGWLANGFADGGIGIQAKAFPAVDIDVTDEAIASRLEQFAISIIPGTPLVRYGRHPKRLLMYRTESPFGKSASRFFEDNRGI
jgi:hypothetical protein